jgi:hypothetical protein
VNGCDSLVNIPVTINNVTLTVSTTAVSCLGGSDGTATANPDGGTAPYTFSWNTGESTQTISGLTPGSYTVTATDAAGCTATNSGTVAQENNAPDVNAGVDQTLTCTNSSITLTATSSTPSVTFAWVGGPNGVSKTVSATGTYTVIATNTAFGCTASDEVTIDQDITEPNVDAGVDQTLTCTTTSILLTASSTTPGATFEWVGGPSGATKTVSAAGTYTVVATNSANGCTASDEVSVDQAPSQITVTCTPTQILCFGGKGTIVVTATGGVAPLSGTGTFSNLTAGSYTYTVTDVNGCTGSCSSMINAAPSQVVATCTPTHPACFGAKGSITVTAVGGTGSYSGTGTFNNLSAGTYNYTVTDANGCTGSCSATINAAPGQVVATCTPTHPACYGGKGSITVTAVGGTGSYSGTGTFSNLSAGTYNYTVTDANGCTGSCSATIRQPNQLSISCSSSNSTGVISTTTTGGTSPYRYLWSPGGSTSANLSTSSSGTYTVTVTDNNGCTATTSCNIIINCNGFRTQTQGGWGAVPKGKNPGMYMTNRFAAAFPAPNYLTVGCTSGNKLRLTSAQAVTNFLPSGSTARALPAGTLVNPGSSYSNVLAGQVVALTLSVTFDVIDPNFSSASTNLRDLIIATGPFAGWTVSQVLAEANKKLGGCSSPYSFSQLNDAVTRINENFDNGATDNHFLVCPGNIRTSGPLADTYEDENLSISAYPNPFSSIINIEFMKLDENSRAVLEIYDLNGKMIGRLFDGIAESGVRYKLTFDGSNLPAGIYLYRLVVNNNLHTGRISLMK